MQEQISANRLLAWQFDVRQWMFYVMHVASGMGAVMWLYRFGPVALLGTLLATITIAAFFVPAKPAFVDLGIIAVLCALSLVAVSFEELRLRPEAEVLWWIELVGLGVLPTVVGFFRKHLSTFATYVFAFLFPVGVFCVFSDDDVPTLALGLWAASVMCFAGTAACRHSVRQHHWILLPLAALCLLFGALLVFAFSWAFFFFE